MITRLTLLLALQVLTSPTGAIQVQWPPAPTRITFTDNAIAIYPEVCYRQVCAPMEAVLTAIIKEGHPAR